VIPEKYTIISKDGPISGTLDNIKLSGPRDLSAGVHELTVDVPVNSIAVIWSRAIEKGYSPFEPGERQRGVRNFDHDLEGVRSLRKISLDDLLHLFPSQIINFEELFLVCQIEPVRQPAEFPLARRKLRDRTIGDPTQSRFDTTQENISRP